MDVLVSIEKREWLLEKLAGGRFPYNLLSLAFDQIGLWLSILTGIMKGEDSV